MCNLIQNNLILKHLTLSSDNVNTTIRNISLLNNKWSIQSISKDKIVLKKVQFEEKNNDTINKRVKFYTQTKIGYINNESVKCDVIKYDKSIKYGNPPNSIRCIVEQMILNICRINIDKLQSREKILFLLHNANCYYYTMAVLLSMHYSFTCRENRTLYTKHTLISYKSLLHIENFLIHKTDIIEKINILYRFYNKYIRVNK